MRNLRILDGDVRTYIQYIERRELRLPCRCVCNHASSVAARPFFIRKPGCVRSSACISFLIIQRNKRVPADWGKAQPHHVLQFLYKSGSFDSLKVLIRYGFSPCACQMRFTDALLTPQPLAMLRQLHCVASVGSVCVWATILASFAMCGMLSKRGQPGYPISTLLDLDKSRLQCASRADRNADLSAEPRWPTIALFIMSTSFWPTI